MLFRSILGGMGVGCLLLTGLLWMTRQAEARSPWLEFTTLEGSQWRVCRYLLAEDDIICEESLGDTWARAWSPDGAWLAFLADRDGTGFPQLYRRRPFAQTPQRIPTDIRLTTLSIPSWSPEGDALAVVGQGQVNSEVFRVNVTDGTTQRLTENIIDDWQPSWSPDGEWIAFTSRRDDNLASLYLMRADGSAVREMLPGLRHAFRPAWSPDGEWMVFQSNCGGLEDDPAADTECGHSQKRFNLYRVHVASGETHQLMDTPEVDDLAAAWSPDGEWIAFMHHPIRRSPTIHLIRPDGSESRRLTHGERGFVHPVWGPVVDMAWSPPVLGLGGLLLLGLGMAWPRRR